MSIKKMTKSEAGKLGNDKSRITQQANKKKKIDQYNKDPIFCKECDEQFPYEKRNNKFCDTSCAAKYNNRGVRRHGNVPSDCLNCGQRVASSANKYCNLQCHIEHKWKQQKLIIEEGNGLSGTVKKYLLEANGPKCNRCKLTEWQDEPIPLDIEHKDGNSDNNSLSNVELLCQNCHALTPTYKARNKGNGRWKRRQRYADGKSF